MSEHATFQELIRRVRAGEADAASDLLRLYEPAIRRAIHVRLVDSRLRRLFDSTDICQSVFGSFFVRAALGEYHLNDPKDLLNLLFDMSRKKLINQQRRAAAARRDYRRTSAVQLEQTVCPNREDSPSQEAAFREMLGEARKRLSLDERRLAELRAEGTDWEEIAAREGGTPEALRKRLTRAMDRVTHDLGLAV